MTPIEDDRRTKELVAHVNKSLSIKLGQDGCKPIEELHESEEKSLSHPSSFGPLFGDIEKGRMIQSLEKESLGPLAHVEVVSYIGGVHDDDRPIYDSGANGKRLNDLAFVPEYMSDEGSPSAGLDDQNSDEEKRVEAEVA